jgi:glycerol dehydrogenase-like iron-containing ADH family enzyme
MTKEKRDRFIYDVLERATQELLAAGIDGDTVAGALTAHAAQAAYAHNSARIARLIVRDAAEYCFDEMDDYTRDAGVDPYDDGPVYR